MKFKLNDRVSWSIFNLTGTVIDILSNIVYIKWDEGNHTISYNTFECRNMEVILPVLLIGDRVSLKNSSHKGVIISYYDYNSLFVQWDGSSEYFYVRVKDLTRDNSNVATNDKLKVTAEVDTTPIFKVGDRIAHKKSSNKGVIICNYTTIYTPTLLAVQWDGSSEYFYISPKDLTLDNSIVATNDKLKVTLEVDITLNVKDELFKVAEQMVSILVKHKDYDSAKQLLECIELLNNLTKPK
jgi:hypothetical protein